LLRRLYKLNLQPPNGLNKKLTEDTHKLDGIRVFEPIPGRLRFFERHESVDVDAGVKVHYLYDAPYKKALSHNRSVAGAIASAVSTCALVHKNEMYDVQKGRNWSLKAPLCGIPFGARHISVHIELDDHFDVYPEGYRQHLRYDGGDQALVSVEDFAEIVRENRPKWLKDIIDSFAPSDSVSNDDIRDRAMAKALQYGEAP